MINLVELLVLPLLAATSTPLPVVAQTTSIHVASDVITRPSGLRYVVIRSGPSSGRQPSHGDLVTFDYEGKLLTGEVFDSSFERGAPLTGRVGRFVPGFNEALTLMRPGDEWMVWIPPKLGYGSRALEGIPANSVLEFRLALRGVGPNSTP